MVKLYRWFGVVAVALVLLFAFGRSGTTVQAQSFNGLLITVNITSDDVAGFSADTQLLLLGTWTIAFDNNGGYAVGKDSTVTAIGLWASDGSVISLSDVGGPFACTGDNATGTYNTTTDGSSYAFTTISDSCQGREFLMTVHRFTVQ